MRRLKISAGIIILSLALLAFVFWRWLWVDLPHPDQLYQRAGAPSTNIFDRNGTLLYQITDPHQGYHTPLTLDEIPLACRNATIATEDATFYSNPGFDARAMLRALLANLRARSVVSGASTITQQLARNLLFLPAQRTEISLTRKLREIILAWRLTNAYSKDQILTLYLNETYYGNLAYGLEAAANTTFGKHAAELDQAECAMLAGLPQSPVAYNPLENLPAAKARQKDVLNLMFKHGFLTANEAALAEQEKLQFAAVPFPIKAPHFVMYVRGQLERQFGLKAIYTQGLQVTTTLDLNTQNLTRRAAQFRLSRLAEAEDGLPPRNVRNAAVIVLHPNTGEVLAMLGSPNYFEPRIEGNVNAAVALRQPGSSIKPITYAAAFDPDIAARYGYTPLTPATVMSDVRNAFVTREGVPYVPQNYDYRWRGPVLLRPALASSLNLIAVKVLNYVGLEAMTDLARQLGITTFDDAGRFGLALTLGGGEVRLLELTAAYAAFANQGRRVEPVTILSVSNAKGQTLYRRRFEPGKQVLDPRAAYLITNILSDNKARAGAFGENSALRLSRPAAAKTGTTTDFRDNWTIGYTSDFVVGVWAGNVDNQPMRHVSGVTGAAPIWHDVMEGLHKNLPARPFLRPQELVTETVCAVNGLLPSAGCQRTIEEIFIAGTQPAQRDNWHKRLLIDRRNGLLAGPDCPPEYTIARWFTLYPTDLQPWAKKNITRQPPQAYSPRCQVKDESGRQKDEISALQPPSSFRLHPSAFRFTSPDQGARYRFSPEIPAKQQKIRVAVLAGPEIAPNSVRLLVNGQPLFRGTETLWQLSPGHYVFEAVGEDKSGTLVRESVEIEVE